MRPGFIKDITIDAFARHRNSRGKQITVIDKMSDPVNFLDEIYFYEN